MHTSVTAPSGRPLLRSTAGPPVSPSERLVDPDHLREGWRLELPREAEHPSAHDRQTAHPQPTGRPDHLPELLVLGLGSLTCAALARRSRRRFRIPPFVDPLDSSLLPSERAVDTATLLHRFDGVPALRSFETANRLLGLAVLEEGRPGPKVRLVQVGPTGVTFHFLAPERQAPEPLRSVDGGRAWHVNHNTLENAIDPCDPYLPLAFPVGDDDEGTWLMAPGPGDVVPLLGEGAPDLQRAARRGRVVGLVRRGGRHRRPPGPPPRRAGSGPPALPRTARPPRSGRRRAHCGADDRDCGGQ